MFCSPNFDPFCNFNLGGFKRLWAAKRSANQTPIIVTSQGTITYIDGTLDWLELPINREGSCVEVAQDGGYVQTLEFQLIGKRAERQMPAASLNTGRWAFVMLDNNDKFWAIGLEGSGARKQQYTGNIGQIGDLQGYRYTFTSTTSSNMKGIVSDAFDPDLELDCPTELDSPTGTGAFDNYGSEPLWRFGNCLWPF